ncbi:unnamed protein product, partial [Closterium sp. Yama58-4]
MSGPVVLSSSAIKPACASQAPSNSMSLSSSPLALKLKPMTSHAISIPFRHGSSLNLPLHGTQRRAFRPTECRIRQGKKPVAQLSQLSQAAVAVEVEEEVDVGIMQPHEIHHSQPHLESPGTSSGGTPPGSPRRGAAKSAGSGKTSGDRAGASSVASGVRLEGVTKTFKGVQLLTDISWEVKRGERVGLVGIAYLTQEFDVVPSRTVREEFLSAFAEQMDIKDRLEEVQAALERATEDMELMSRLLDELDDLQKKAEALDLYSVDVAINKMMPELGFGPEDSERLVASYSGGWQMRMSLGKILLQQPDLLLLDEPTNHLDLDAIEWLEKYLKQQDVPMVIVSHDRAFLDQLCNKIVETEMGISMTFPGNYSAYVAAKAEWVEAQRMAWERQQKEIARTEDMIARLQGGGNAGRASSAEKALERLQVEGAVEKPFERKQMRFRFPELERSGRITVQIANLSHSYAKRSAGNGGGGEEQRNELFDKAKLQIERGEKLAFIGPNGCGKSTLLRFIVGFEEPEHGIVALGEHRVVPNYFAQNQ